MLRVTPLLLLLLLVLCTTGCISTQTVTVTRAPVEDARNDADSAREILTRYAEAWRGREEMTLREETTLAFWIEGEDGGEYGIVLPVDGSASLHEGAPDSFTVGFRTDIETLRRLDRGEWNALTAMAQARAGDPIPLQPVMPPEFVWTAEARGYMLPLLFHFWNRAWPEVVRFGDGTTRPVHGANATVLAYDAGLRSAWYQVEPGMHINADPEDQVNGFHTLVIVTRGSLSARLGGVERLLLEGEAVFIPAGMSHEFWADSEQYGELVILMYGEGA